MSQSTITTKKKNRFLAFLTSLCSAQPTRDDNSNDKKKSKFKINKIPRLTFQLDRVLVKVSRKNVVEQQFMQNDVLTYHLEKYLATRFKQCDIAIFAGQFSNFLIQKIPFCLEIKTSKQEFYEKQNNYILTNHINSLKFKCRSVDLMVFQFYFGEQENVHQKKSSKLQQLTDDEIKLKINSNLDQIQQTLRLYQKKVKNFVFVCHKDLKLEDVHDLFLVFKENYFFEFQKVKKVQKTVCNIIYVSTQTKFLKIDDSSLSEFMLCQFDKMRSFGGIKKNTQSTLKTDSSKNIKLKEPLKNLKKEEKDKIHQKITLSNEGIKRQGFQILINQMFERNLHLKVTQALASILQNPEKKMDKLNWFLDLLHEKSPQSRDLIDSYRINPGEENDQQMNKTSSELTPIFVQKFKDSHNYSKVTAIFQTQLTPHENFIFYDSPRKKEEFEPHFNNNEF